MECVSQLKGTHERAPGPYLPEFQAVCYIYLGRKGEIAALMAANIIVIGALITYYVLMSKEFCSKSTVTWSRVEPHQRASLGPGLNQITVHHLKCPII